MMRFASAIIAISTAASACNAASIHSDRPEYDGHVPSMRDAGHKESEGLGEEQLLFRPHIQSDIESTGCPLCHSDGTFPFQIIESPTTEDEWRTNYEETAARIGDGSSAPLVDRPLGSNGHPVVLRAESDVPERWREWIHSGAPYQPGASPGRVTRDGGPGETGDDPITWAAVREILSSNDCMRCHGDAGEYSLETLEATMGPGSDDVPNVIAGDAESLLVQYCRNGHQGIGYRDALTVLAWIVEWNARAE